MNPFALSMSTGKTSVSLALRHAQGERVGKRVGVAAVQREVPTEDRALTQLNVVTP
jgi:hypothetical protein